MTNFGVGFIKARPPAFIDFNVARQLVDIAGCRIAVLLNVKVMREGMDQLLFLFLSVELNVLSNP